MVESMGKKLRARKAVWFICLLALAQWVFSSGNAEAATPELRLTQHVVHDQSANMKAMVAVTPSDWRFSGQAAWDGQSIAYPARVSFQADGPADGAQVRYLPMENYNYVTGRPVGQRMNGIVMLPAMSAEQYLQTLFQNLRPQAANVSIVKRHRPDWIMTLLQENVRAEQNNIVRSGMQGQASGDACEITVTYSEGGQRWEECLYTGISYVNVVLQTQMRPTFTAWTTSGVVSKRAHSGKYQAHQAEFEIIEKNAEVDPEWFIAMAGVGQQLIQRQHFELRRNFKAAQDMVAAKRQINESTRQVIRERQASSDRIARMREDSILGIDRYQSSEGRVGLPSGYKHAWERKNGDIIMTDSPTFNPNETNPGEWGEIQKSRY